MIIIRERDPYTEPFNARGLCDCGHEMELPLEAHTYATCLNCGKRYDCDGNVEVEE